MQAEHHLGKSEPRVVERNPVVAGEHKFEAAAQAIAVDDRDRRTSEMIETIDDRVPLREAALDPGHIRHGAELADVGTGDEACRLGRADHQPLRQIALERLQHVIELDQHILGERIGARALLVEHEPGDAVLVARELPVPPRTRSCSRRRARVPYCAGR